MILLRCTRKLLRGHPAQPVPSDGFATAPLTEWYANVAPLPFRGRSLVMYTSRETLVTVVAPGRSIGTTFPVFRSRLPAMLSRLGAPERWIQAHSRSLADLYVAPTADRRVLGSMTDLSRQIWYRAGVACSFEGLDLDALELELAETPLSLLGYRSSRHTLRALVEAEPNP